MTRISPWLFLAALVLLPAAAAAASGPPNAEFEKMRSLIGDWVGTAVMSPAVPEARPPGMRLGGDLSKPAPAEEQHWRVDLSVRPIASGTTLMETMRFPDGMEMVTVYYPYGPHLMLTHYCSSNTQPRMRTLSAPADLHELRFEFMDGTNMMNSSDNAMANLHVMFDGPDRFRQEWYPQGKNAKPIAISYKRQPKAP